MKTEVIEQEVTEGTEESYCKMQIANCKSKIADAGSLLSLCCLCFLLLNLYWARCYTCGMKFRLILGAAFLLQFAVAAWAAAPAVELELVTERGVQITAPQQWLQLLAGIGIEQVRIRGMQPGDEPQLVNTGNAERASYHVVGVLTSREQLRLPGGTFSRADRVKLKDYFARLAADGADSVTAPHVRFGLTEKELSTVLADLAQPIDFETKGLASRGFVDRLQTKRSFKIAVDGQADRVIRSAAPLSDELRGVSAGAGLAIALRNCGLVMRPEKTVGQPIVYRVVPAGTDAVAQPTIGRMSAPDMAYWPIGWDQGKPPGEIAPSLRESLNAEIDGYTLEEALRRDRPTIEAANVHRSRGPQGARYRSGEDSSEAGSNADELQASDRSRARAAHLGCEIRVDEAGEPFLWVTR